jgi:hypothetical protein
MDMPTPCHRCGRWFDLHHGHPCHVCRIVFCRRCARDTPTQGWRCRDCLPSKRKSAEIPPANAEGGGK